MTGDFMRKEQNYCNWCLGGGERSKLMQQLSFRALRQSVSTGCTPPPSGTVRRRRRRRQCRLGCADGVLARPPFSRGPIGGDAGVISAAANESESSNSCGSGGGVVAVVDNGSGIHGGGGGDTLFARSLGNETCARTHWRTLTRLSVHVYISCALCPLGSCPPPVPYHLAAPLSLSLSLAGLACIPSMFSLFRKKTSFTHHFARGSSGKMMRSLFHSPHYYYP
mmetsp:Transcript_86386/g.230756  ORF Transcript_86386/g.230756 Transcript_86386/m.230756 type:complete len:223 (+) Transcript_86386:214-882(+)